MWDNIEPPLKQLLWRVCQFRGDAFPKISRESQWTPFLTGGLSAEDVLRDPAFDAFRVDPLSVAACATVAVEQPNDGWCSQDAQRRYLRRVALGMMRLELHACGPWTGCTSPLFDRHYAGSVRGRAAAMLRDHDPSVVDRYLYHTVYNYLQASKFAGGIVDAAADDVERAATLDALLVVHYNHWGYTDRWKLDNPAACYYARSRTLCASEGVLAFQLAFPQPLGVALMATLVAPKTVDQWCRLLCSSVHVR